MDNQPIDDKLKELIKALESGLYRDVSKAPLIKPPIKYSKLWRDLNEK